MWEDALAGGNDPSMKVVWSTLPTWFAYSAIAADRIPENRCRAQRSAGRLEDSLRVGRRPSANWTRAATLNNHSVLRGAELDPALTGPGPAGMRGLDELIRSHTISASTTRAGRRPYAPSCSNTVSNGMGAPTR